MFIAYLPHTSSCQGRGPCDRGSCKYILGNVDSPVELEDTNTHNHRLHGSLLHTSSYLYSKPTVRETCTRDNVEVFFCDCKLKSLTVGLFEVVVQHNVLGRQQVLHYFRNVFSRQTICTQDASTGGLCPKHFLLCNTCT